MPQTLQNTLYLLTPGLSVRRDGLALRIEQEKQLKLSLPIHNCESIFVFGPEIYVSPSAMRLCWEHGASICFFTDWGRLEARVEGVPQGPVLLRRAQHTAASDPARAAALGRAIAAGKIHNTRWLLARSSRDAQAEADASAFRAATNELAFLLPELERATDLDIIRGCEGRAAAWHFEIFTRHLRPAVREKFPMDGRNRRPPRDAINCLLSFLYALLRHDCVSALAAVGLDPFVGFSMPIAPAANRSPSISWRSSAPGWNVSPSRCSTAPNSSPPTSPRGTVAPLNSERRRAKPSSRGINNASWRKSPIRSSSKRCGTPSCRSSRPACWRERFATKPRPTPRTCSDNFKCQI